jgi:DNA mismatch repair ATPase MutS
MNENIELSPMVKQFYELKSENPEALLLFRTGDFYETYSEDAEEASKILGITLTKSTIRKDKDGEHLKIAGFQHRALDTYLPKLIRAGKRIAICEQIEDPHIKKLVKMGSQKAKEKYHAEVALYEQYGTRNTIGFEEWLDIKGIHLDD